MSVHEPDPGHQESRRDEPDDVGDAIDRMDERVGLDAEDADEATGVEPPQGDEPGVPPEGEDPMGGQAPTG